MREIRLVGSIEAVTLHDGMLEVEVEGQTMQFPVGGQQAAAAPPPRRRRTNGNGKGAQADSEQEEEGDEDGQPTVPGLLRDRVD